MSAHSCYYNDNTNNNYYCYHYYHHREGYSSNVTPSNYDTQYLRPFPARIIGAALSILPFCELGRKHPQISPYYLLLRPPSAQQRVWADWNACSNSGGKVRAYGLLLSAVLTGHSLAGITTLPPLLCETFT